MANADQNNPYGIPAPPSTGGTTTGPSPLFPDVPTPPRFLVGIGAEGVPPSSVSPYGTPYQSYQYVQGDEWGPGADLSSIPTIQAEMVAAGLLDKSDVRVGVWDAASADAYKSVLGFAQSQAITPTLALSILVSNPPLGGTSGSGRGGGGGGAQTPTYFTNPADVASQYRSTSAGLTGQEQDPAAFQAYYHGLEAQAGKQTGANITRTPSVSGAAEQYLLNNDPQDVMAYGIASRMNTFLSMIGTK